MAKVNKTREMLVNKYIEALEQQKLPWDCGWNIKTPSNAISGVKYHGVNNALLTFVASEKGYKGSRWCTFNQIADKNHIFHKDENWKLKEGSMGVPIEYWYFYNRVEKKAYTWKQYKEAMDLGREQDNFILCNKVYYVFNEDCIEGIQKVEELSNENINQEEVINNIMDNMNVNCKEMGNSAFYNVQTDTIVIPPKETFKTQYDYDSTLLHELCHSTGHDTRLNRDLKNTFGTPEYAKEELRAEISSSFLMQELNLPPSESNIKNHQAYIQSWIDVLKNDPSELFRAIKDSDQIVDYVLGKSSLVLDKEEECDLELC